MSYDLMVFDPAVPCKDRGTFMAWYDQQTQWTEPHGYNNPDIPTASLKEWFKEMILEFPPMNGPLASDDVDSPKVTDYSLGKQVIYSAFAWSEAKRAREVFYELAKKHKIGFFDVSAENGGVWLPSPDGKYVCLHGGQMDGHSRHAL